MFIHYSFFIFLFRFTLLRHNFSYLLFFFSSFQPRYPLFKSIFILCILFLSVFFTFFCISVNCIFKIFHSSPLFSTCPLLHSNDCLFFFPQTTSHYIFFRYFFFFLITASSPSSRTLMTP